LSSKHGQQYQCVLPQLENLLEKKNDENQHITKDEIPQLLEPMKKKCLFNVSPCCVWFMLICSAGFVRKPVNANPRIKVNGSINFSCVTNLFPG